MIAVLVLGLAAISDYVAHRTSAEAELEIVSAARQLRVGMGRGEATAIIDRWVILQKFEEGAGIRAFYGPPFRDWELEIRIWLARHLRWSTFGDRRRYPVQVLFDATTGQVKAVTLRDEGVIA